MSEKHYRHKYEFTLQNVMSEALQKTSGQIKTLMDLVVANVIVSSKVIFFNRLENNPSMTMLSEQTRWTAQFVRIMQPLNLDSVFSLM